MRDPGGPSPDAIWCLASLTSSHVLLSLTSPCRLRDPTPAPVATEDTSCSRYCVPSRASDAVAAEPLPSPLLWFSQSAADEEHLGAQECPNAEPATPPYQLVSSLGPGPRHYSLNPLGGTPRNTQDLRRTKSPEADPAPRRPTWPSCGQPECLHV